MRPEICLYQPLIPQNTGAICRLAAAVKCTVHLVRPLGFSIEDKMVRRAGLDYWPYVDLKVHNDLNFCLDEPHTVAFISKYGLKTYDAIPKHVRYLVFGRETTGLPRSLHEAYRENFFRIPMFEPKVRSLNLANAVSIVLYEQLRIRKFFLDETGQRLTDPEFSEQVLPNDRGGNDAKMTFA